MRVWLWGQGSSKPGRKGERFLSVKVTLKDWNCIIQAARPRTLVASRLLGTWRLAGLLCRHTPVLFLSRYRHAHSLTRSCKALPRWSYWQWGRTDEGPGFRSLPPWLQFHRLPTVLYSAVGASESERLPPGMHSCMHTSCFGRGWALAAKRPGTKQLHWTGRWLAEKRR